MTEQAPTLRTLFDVSERVATPVIAEAIDESVWEIVGIPPRLRVTAAAKIAKALDAFLSTSLLGLVSASLEGNRELATYADDRDHEVKIDLSITSAHEPYVHLRVAGLEPQAVTFPLSVALRFSGATLVISGNRVMSMKPGRCLASGTLYCEELVVFERPQAPFKLRNEIPFGDGLPILAARQRASARAD